MSYDGKPHGRVYAVRNVSARTTCGHGRARTHARSGSGSGVPDPTRIPVPSDPIGRYSPLVLGTSNRDKNLRAKNARKIPVTPKTRNAILAAACWRCSTCHAKRELEVHVVDGAFVVQCRACVEAAARVRLFTALARVVLKLDPTIAIADLSDETKRLAIRYRIPVDAPALHRALEAFA